MVCQPDCATCSGNNYTCSSCNTGTFLLDTSCVTKCPYVGYYQNSTSRVCAPCNPSCLVCVASTTDCISCQPTALYSSRACLASCPPEHFTSADGNCYPCDPACKNCTGSLNSECSVCNSGYYLMGNTCDITCPEPFYANTTLLECKECKYYCNGCTTRDNCYACKPGYPALPGSNCTGGYYLRTTNTFKL
jgi:proprotein convertase subtilisin/kexin type 5